VLGYFAISLAVLLAISLLALVTWTGLLFDRLEPLTRMNVTGIESISSETFISMLGQDGLLITAGIYFVGIAAAVTILLAYKACFYRQMAVIPPPILQVAGEYDSKGRWYKY
jgi:hypothetical protein